MFMKLINICMWCTRCDYFVLVVKQIITVDDNRIFYLDHFIVVIQPILSESGSGHGGWVDVYLIQNQSCIIWRPLILYRCSAYPIGMSTRYGESDVAWVTFEYPCTIPEICVSRSSGCIVFINTCYFYRYTGFHRSILQATHHICHQTILELALLNLTVSCISIVLYLLCIGRVRAAVGLYQSFI